MAKRDIRVNYDCLAVVERQLKKQRNALEKLRTAMGKADSAASAGNTAQSIEGLKKRYKKAKKRLDDCYEEVDALYNLIHGYIRDMTGIIQPKRGMTHVGRNDIYMNLQSVKHGIDDIRDVQDSHFMFPSSGIGKTEEEKRKMKRNYEKIETQVWGRLFPAMRKTVEESRKKLQGYYDHEIKDYENKDNEYKRKSETVRYQYSSPWELFKQNTIDTVNFAWSIVKGVGMAGLDFLKGFYSIGNMIYYGVSADVAAIVYLAASDPPEWTEEVLGESEEYFGNIAYAVSHPVETVEAMVQSANDTFEEEGLAYMVSYVITDFALGKAMAGGGKADDVTDVAKVADDADEVVDVAKTANKADDVTDVTKAADKADEVADVAKTADKVEDASDAVNTLEKVEDAYDDLDDLYESIYESQYDEAFDPIKEGAILDPDDVDDLADLAEDADKIITDGSHMSNGKLKSNIKYKTGEYDYVYTTDSQGRIKKIKAEDLKLTKRKKRLKHNANTPGKLKGDHAGHLIGDQFGGSPQLDNLASQLGNVNLSKYKKIENLWKKALKEGKKVTADIKVKYQGNNVRPVGFDVKYTIDGEKFRQFIKN